MSWAGPLRRSLRGRNTVINRFDFDQHLAMVVKYTGDKIVKQHWFSLGVEKA